MNMGKIGRNEACPCGSGKKYKKCCLWQSIYCEPTSATKTLDEDEVDEEEHLGESKMSAIILDYAKDMLALASSKRDQETAIMLAIAAWNLSMFKESDRDKALASLFKEMKIKEDSDVFNDMSHLIQTLICMKQQDYPDINRFIVGHDLVISKNEIRLNVVSTIFNQSTVGV
jgi:hypothetical protein